MVVVLALGGFNVPCGHTITRWGRGKQTQAGVRQCAAVCLVPCSERMWQLGMLSS
jgi:hypothetical protein